MPSIINATTTNGLVTSADNSGELRLQTNSGTTAVTITTTQDIGIGTTSPYSANGTNVEVADSTIARLLLNQTGTRRISLGAGSNAFNIYDETAGAERVKITSTGVFQVGNENGTGEVFAQNTVKVWGVLTGSGTLYNSFGISSSSKISTGVYQINYSRTFGSSRFGCGLSQYSEGWSFINNESTTLCRVNTRNASNNNVDADVQFLIAAGS